MYVSKHKELFLWMFKSARLLRREAQLAAGDVWAQHMRGSPSETPCTITPWSICKYSISGARISAALWSVCSVWHQAQQVEVQTAGATFPGKPMCVCLAGWIFTLWDQFFLQPWARLCPPCFSACWFSPVGFAVLIWHFSDLPSIYGSARICVRSFPIQRLTQENSLLCKIGRKPDVESTVWIRCPRSAGLQFSMFLLLPSVHSEELSFMRHSSVATLTSQSFQWPIDLTCASFSGANRDVL